MPFIPFGEWVPDQPDFKPMNGTALGSTGSKLIQNCVPLTNGSYGPAPTASVYSANALTNRCQGSYSLYDANGNASIMAGDSTRLYRIAPGSASFTDISRQSDFTATITTSIMTVINVTTGSLAVGDTITDVSATVRTITSFGTGTGGIGTYHVSPNGSVGTPIDMKGQGGGTYGTPTVASFGFWSFTSFGARVIATNGSDDVQTFLLGTDTYFSKLSSAAPIAKYAAVIKDFLFLGNISSQPYRVHWSAIGDPTSWPTVGTSAAQQVQSDQQDLQESDLGRISGVVGGLQSADGAVFMERGIYRVLYTGSPAFFSFKVASGASGTRAPLSIVRRQLDNGAAVSYYWGDEDFYAFDGIQSIPIGGQRWAKFFAQDMDQSYLPMIQSTSDPQNKLLFWAYMANGSNGLFNRLIVYNWEVNRACVLDYSANPFEWLTRSIYGTGYTLEGLDAFGTLDTLPASLDSPVWVAGNLTLSGFNQHHKLAVATGTAMAPTLETMETQFFEGQRSRIGKIRPQLDGGAPSVLVGTRDKLTDPVSWTLPISTNALGECDFRLTGRFTRFRLTLPAGSSFTHIQGLDVGLSPAGRR